MSSKNNYYLEVHWYLDASHDHMPLLEREVENYTTAMTISNFKHGVMFSTTILFSTSTSTSTTSTST
jgi:hypothetical protein